MAHIAVITGDLINSTGVNGADGFRQRLSELLNLVNEKYTAHSTIYRGDGFQIALDGGKFNAFEVALLLRTGLISQSPDTKNRWDARVAIAFADGVLSSIDQNSPAFVNSGKTLDRLGKEHFRVYDDNEASRLALGVATSFADEILNRLSQAEAEALFYYLMYQESHQSIATRIGKKRPTITKALQRAKYLLLDRYINDMDKFVKLRHG